MNRPFFSIVIPAYNNTDLLSHALKSVLKQEKITFEVIVTDDSTTDDIEKYINTISDNRVIYKHNKPSLGAVKNWNCGIKNAIGEYVIIMHHDESFSYNDYLYDIKSEIMKGHDVIVSNVRVFVNGIDHRKKIVQLIEPYTINHPSLLFAINSIGPCACITINRKKIQDFDDRLKWFVDVEWYYRILSSSKNAKYLVNKAIDSFHGHKGQITENINITKAANHDYKILKIKYRKSISIKVLLILNRILFSERIKRLITKITK